MAPKKLTEADKTSILSLYRQPEETTSTLAERYGVSNSTISRLLKASLPEAEYSTLIQQKRGASGDKTSGASPASPGKPTKTKASKPAKVKAEANEAVPEAATSAPAAPEVSAKKTAPVLKKRDESAPESALEPAPEATPESIPEPALEEKSATGSAPARRRRSRSKGSAKDPDDSTQLVLPEPETVAPEVVTELAATESAAEAPSRPERPILKSAATAVAAADASASEWDDDDDDDGPALDDDYGDDDDEDDDDDGDMWDNDESQATPHLEALEIYPLTAKALPSLCYLVVERSSSELVALPLRTFADLGQIPEEEGESRTLPVFDNHRIARRFSRRNQRVIKVPDGSLLHTTSAYLQAKGITRLLIDGQVFALEDAADPVASPVPSDH
jgi:hypothetical protein